MITKQDLLNLTKEEEPTRLIAGKQVKMKFNPFENVPAGFRRCGECGKTKQYNEFKKIGKPGYDWRCPDCNEYLGVYNDN